MFAPLNIAAAEIKTLCGGFFLPRSQKEAKNTTNPSNPINKMIKTKDVPHNLRDFNNQFMVLTDHGRYDTYTLFTDYIDYCLNYFLLDESTNERQAKLLEKYPGKEEEFYKLLLLTMDVMKTQIFKSTHKWAWYDLFGTYYEILASSYKRSAFGQFFTPEHVCDMMAMMVGPIEGNSLIVDGDSYPSVNDPACGSGRNLLAANKQANGKVVVIGQDLDPVCVKMTALNLALHGVRGEVICGDTLKGDDFRFGYQVNTALKMLGRPHILTRTKEQTITFTPRPEPAKPKLLILDM